MKPYLETTGLHQSESGGGRGGGAPPKRRGACADSVRQSARLARGHAGGGGVGGKWHHTRQILFDHYGTVCGGAWRGDERDGPHVESMSQSGLPTPYDDTSSAPAATAPPAPTATGTAPPEAALFPLFAVLVLVSNVTCRPGGASAPVKTGQNWSNTCVRVSLPAARQRARGWGGGPRWGADRHRGAGDVVHQMAPIPYGRVSGREEGACGG